MPGRTSQRGPVLAELPQGIQRAQIGVSGGADSTALLCLLSQSPLSETCRFHATHVHHGLRGEAADGDQAFVEDLCASLNIPVTSVAVDVRTEAEAQGVSLEMAARNARTRVFQEIAQTVQSPHVFLGHTLEDQVETVLMKWGRGAAPGALAGMTPRSERDGLILHRPMLGLRRDALRDWLRAVGTSWREDQDNTDPRFLRNRVRHELLPVLQQVFGEGWLEAAARLCRIQGEEEVVLQSLAEELFVLDQPQLEGVAGSDHPAALLRRVLMSWIRRHTGAAPSGAVLESMVASLASREGSCETVINDAWSVRREYADLKLMARSASTTWTTVEIQIPGRICAGPWTVETRLESGYKVDSDRSPRIPAEGWISVGVLQDRQLSLRGWKAGDRIRPLGLEGHHKKLQDIFSDAQVSRSVRASFPVLVCEDLPIWLPGYSVDQAWAVESADSPSVYMRITPSSSD